MNARKKQPEESFTNQPFKDLKKIIGNGRPLVPAQAVPERKNKPVTDEDLFREAMREVREIPEFREIPVRRANVPPACCGSMSSDSEAMRALEEIARGRAPLNLPDTQEYVEWVNPDYHGEIAKKLHKGHFAVQDCLDLHGMNVETADAEVDGFLRDSLKRRLRCVKIIHGRGLRSPHGPVLKKALTGRLSHRYSKYFIAFVTARQCDGGLGALYILLQ